MSEGSDRTLKMLATALEKEEWGRDFYKEAVQKCKNDLGKEIFRMLLADEGIHIKRCKDIYEALKGGKAWSDDWKAYKTDKDNLQQLFRGRYADLGTNVSADSDDLAALDVGIRFEKGAVEFYEDELTKAVDPMEKDFIEAMIVEEKDHHKSLVDAKSYLSDPENWHSEMERHGFDGA